MLLRNNKNAIQMLAGIFVIVKQLAYYRLNYKRSNDSQDLIFA